MTTVEKAIRLAAEYHEGQTDKVGEPYLLHSIRVMMNAASDEEKMVAILHDVVEKTDCSAEKLLSEGFSRHVVEAVQALTKNSGETEEEAMNRIRSNPLARRVKMLDIQDNLEMLRMLSDSN